MQSKIRYITLTKLPTSLTITQYNKSSILFPTPHALHNMSMAPNTAEGPQNNVPYTNILSNAV